MLKIRASQMNRFEKRSEHRLAKLMREAYPEMCQRLERHGTNERVNNGLAEAQGHGFDEPEEQERYAQLLFLTDSDQLDQVWAQEVLAWDSENDMKLAALERSAQLAEEGRI